MKQLLHLIQRYKNPSRGDERPIYSSQCQALHGRCRFNAHQHQYTNGIKPAAPLYSILTYGQHEHSQILLNKLNGNLKYYNCFIDNIFRVWLDTENESWSIFKTQLNQFDDLKWKVEDLTLETIFLDLEITIKDNKLYTITYQKPFKLHLYPPPSFSSSHQLLQTVNSWRDSMILASKNIQRNFIMITSLFIDHLLQRGHIFNQIVP